jgi:hypothetical protein
VGNGSRPADRAKSFGLCQKEPLGLKGNSLARPAAHPIQVSNLR